MLENFKLFAFKATYVFGLIILSTAVVLGGIILTVIKLDQDLGYPRTFSVEGYSSKDVALDTAEVSVGVTIRDDSPLNAQRQANEKYSKAIEAIKSVGIPEENIKTQNYNISDVQNYETREVEGYETDLRLVIKIEDTNPQSEFVSKVINAATENGFNRVDNLRFYLADRQSIEDEIKEMAIEDAKMRAEKESEASGLKLGDVINMYSYGGGGYEPYYDTYASKSSVMLEEAAAPVPNIEIQPGETEVTVTVTLEYEIL